MNLSTVFTSIKLAEILVAVKFNYNGDRLYQSYELSSNRPVLKIARDKRYELYDILNKKIKETMLSTLNNKFSFVQLFDDEKVTTIEYSVDGKISKELLVNYFFIVDSFLPPKTGCKYCLHSDFKDTVFVYCNLKNITLSKAINRCVVFRQKSGLFKT